MQIIFKIFKYLLTGTSLLFSVYLIWANINLYAGNYNKTETRQDIQLQLNFLNTELRNNNLANRMQELYPEGFVFVNALYGLSWCELGLSDTSKKTRETALKEALYAYNEINSDQTKSQFRRTLSPEYGIFYIGWNTYLLSKILSLDIAFENRLMYQNLYTKQCDSIVASLKNSNSPFLESYKTQAWPADMVVAMASVSNYDKLYSPKYREKVLDWVVKVKSKLDPKTKLIPHKVQYDTSESIEGARGSSLSLIIRLMSEIDTTFAREQYQLFKAYFFTTTAGLPSILEYPKGQSGSGDIDSGPVVFGVGFAGTLVSIGTFAVMGDLELSKNQYKTINAFGVEYKTNEYKTYLFGLLPIADAFIAWGRSSGLNKSENKVISSSEWRLRFHFISILLLTVIWILYFRNRLIVFFRSNKYTGG